MAIGSAGRESCSALGLFQLRGLALLVRGCRVSLARAVICEDGGGTGALRPLVLEGRQDEEAGDGVARLGSLQAEPFLDSIP